VKQCERLRALYGICESSEVERFASFGGWKRPSGGSERKQKSRVGKLKRRLPDMGEVEQRRSGFQISILEEGLAQS